MPCDAPHISLLLRLLGFWNNSRSAMDTTDDGSLFKDFVFLSELPHEIQCNNDRGDWSNEDDHI